MFKNATKVINMIILHFDLNHQNLERVQSKRKLQNGKELSLSRIAP